MINLSDASEIESDNKNIPVESIYNYSDLIIASLQNDMINPDQARILSNFYKNIPVDWRSA